MNEMHQAPLVLYDGECGICTAFIVWVQAHLADRSVRFRPYQTFPFSSSTIPVTAEQARQALVFYHPDGRAYSGARAVFELFRYLQFPWKVLGYLLANRPMSFVAEPFYRWVARHRKALSRWLDLPACPLPEQNGEK